MLILITENVTNNIKYTAQELHFFPNHLDLINKSFYLDVIPSHQCFDDILQLIYQRTFFYTYSLYSLNILQQHMIYHINIHNYLNSK